MPIPSLTPAPLVPNPFLADPTEPTPSKHPEQFSGQHPGSAVKPPSERPNKASSNEGVKAESSTPPSAETVAKMRTIADLLSRDSLIEMMREPYSKKTVQRLKELRTLLSKDSLNALTRDPAERAHLRSGISQVLSEKNIHVLQREAAAVPNPNLTPEKIRERTFKTDSEESYHASQRIHDELQQEQADTRERTRLCEPLCKNLVAIGQPLSNQATETNAELDANDPAKPPLVKPKSLQPEVPTPPSSPQEVSETSGTRPTPEVLAKLRRIGELLSRDSLIQMLREPNTKQSLQRMEELRVLLSEKSINSLSSHHSELAAFRAGVSQVLSATNLRALELEAAAPLAQKANSAAPQ